MYGALAGHLHRVLPVCHASADILWAYTRCWLESQVDQHLAESLEKGDLANGLRLGKDAVASTQHNHPEEVHRVVLDDVADFWPSCRYHIHLLVAGAVNHFPLQIGVRSTFTRVCALHWQLKAAFSKACAAVSPGSSMCLLYLTA